MVRFICVLHVFIGHESGVLSGSVLYTIRTNTCRLTAEEVTAELQPLSLV